MSLNPLKSTVDEAWLSQSFTFGSKSVPLSLPLLSTFAALIMQLDFPDLCFLKKIDDESRYQSFSAIMVGGVEQRQEMLYNIASVFINWIRVTKR